MTLKNRILVARNYAKYYPSHKGRVITLRKSTLRAQAATLLSNATPTPSYLDQELGTLIRFIDLGFLHGNIYQTTIGTLHVAVFVMSDYSVAIGYSQTPIPPLKGRFGETEKIATMRFIPLIFSLTPKGQALATKTKFRMLKTTHAFETAILDDLRDAHALIDICGPYITADKANDYPNPIAPWCQTDKRPNYNTVLAGAILAEGIEVRHASLHGRCLTDKGTFTDIYVQATNDRVNSVDKSLSEHLTTLLRAWMEKHDPNPINQTSFHYQSPSLGQKPGRKAGIIARFMPQMIKSGHERIEALALWQKN